MKEHGIYFGTNDFYQLIRKLGGQWTDSKERPLYHVGKTDTQSIFFLSDVIPISSKYIEREYKSRHTNKLYIIKNKQLLSDLEIKLKRILSWEIKHPNHFRQHITDIKKHLLNELQQTNF
ncbi:MAG: hypothetical protein IJZ53_03705 [Tyzzerella sp.]|nr:hypothetical protein [Tyzzerella sp.]